MHVWLSGSARPISGTPASSQAALELEGVAVDLRVERPERVLGEEDDRAELGEAIAERQLEPLVDDQLEPIRERVPELVRQPDEPEMEAPFVRLRRDEQDRRPAQVGSSCSTKAANASTMRRLKTRSPDHHGSMPG